MHNENHHGGASFFEKYQTFISIIIAGALIGGGIVLSKTIPQAGAPAANGTTAQQTEATVKADLIKTAKSLSLDSKALGVCLDKNTKESMISEATTVATRSGVQGTPTFIIIKRTYGADDRIVSEKQIPVVGARDKATFMAAIENGTLPAGQPEMSGEKVVLSDTDHYKGPMRAEVIIVEYSDMDCPFCKRAKPTIDGILAEHPEYAYVYRHSPLAQLHPLAPYKAEAAECIYDTNGAEGFWKFVDAIMKQ